MVLGEPVKVDSLYSFVIC